MYEPRLNKLLNLKDSMPSEAFLKLLACKNASTRPEMGTSSASNPVVNPIIDPVAPIAEGTSGWVKDKEKKCHREGGALRHHHHKRS